jgi:hypothetical protein
MLTRRYSTDAKPEENWDADFEFQDDPASNDGSRTSTKDMLLASKLSAGSRAATAEWDAVDGANGTDTA